MQAQETSLWDAEAEGECNVQWLVLTRMNNAIGLARLKCGHGQHVRHYPPWTVREWVVTEVGRRARTGSLMESKLCNEFASPDAVDVQ